MRHGGSSGILSIRVGSRVTKKKICPVRNDVNNVSRIGDAMCLLIDIAERIDSINAAKNTARRNASLPSPQALVIVSQLEMVAPIPCCSDEVESGLFEKY